MKTAIVFLSNECRILIEIIQILLFSYLFDLFTVVTLYITQVFVGRLCVFSVVTAYFNYIHL